MSQIETNQTDIWLITIGLVMALLSPAIMLLDMIIGIGVLVVGGFILLYFTFTLPKELDGDSVTENKK